MVAVAIGASALVMGLMGSNKPGAHVASGAASSDALPAGATPAPWQVRVLASDNLQALGIQVGQSTLGDAMQQYGPDTQVAVIAAANEAGHLEAYVDPLQADFVVGKLVISAEATPAQIEGWRQRAVKAEFMESTTRRFVLSTNDLVEALKSRVTGLSFIPQAQLDVKAVVARFGEPAELVRSNLHAEHLLYPARGIDVMVDQEGKELIQYVTPAAFESRLRRPLLQAVSAAASAASQTR
jgi:hypothetical protein